jgi:putative Ca2+/H+ antiporter (TMEM165/GDT1 family)
VLEAIVSVMFLVGAIFALREDPDDAIAFADREVLTRGRTAATAFVVIFIAEWGDLTQILTANLAAHYNSPFSVGLGSLLALWTVALIAVVGGQGLVRFVNVTVLHRCMAVVLIVLSAITAMSAIRG